MTPFRKIRRKIYRSSPLLRRGWFWLNFVKKNHYLPDFKNPKTYNEKLNLRKRDPKHPLFSICADKIRAKEYVAEKIGQEIIIPNYYVGENIDFDTMKQIIEEKGDCFLKANHNSGPVLLLTTDSTDEEIRSAVENVQQQLAVDFGELANEPWYSDIKRGILVEKRLPHQEGESDIRDYKFHVFKQKDGSFKTFCAIDFDRAVNHSRSFFDKNFTWINIKSHVPSIYTAIEKPVNYEKMWHMAEILAEPFSYARVDFYNNGGHIYFGEITFAPGGGSSKFNDKDTELWFGSLWQQDPRY